VNKILKPVLLTGWLEKRESLQNPFSVHSAKSLSYPGRLSTKLFRYAILKTSKT